MKTAYQFGHTATFREGVAEQLLNKGWYAVEPGTNPGEVIILATPANAIGVVYEYDPHTKRNYTDTPGKADLTVALLSNSGKIKVKLSGAVNYKAPVKFAAGGTVVTATSGNEAIGRYLGANAASGDIVEILLDKHTVA